MGHLVWKTHPEGAFRGLGNSPSIIILFLSFSIRGSGIGTADNKALVYGCSGYVYSYPLSPISTICPRYITAILSLICLITDKSCPINK